MSEIYKGENLTIMWPSMKKAVNEHNYYYINIQKISKPDFSA